MSKKVKQFLLLATICALAHPVLAEDWNQWRGPNRDANVHGLQLPMTWPEALELEWQVDVGTGHASPVVSGETVYLHSRIDEMETASGFDLNTGDVVWRHSYPAEYDMPGAAASHGQGPKSTPLYHDGSLYTFGISGILSCYDAKTGEPRWRHDFVGEFPKPYPLFGTAMSPIAVGDLLIAHVGGEGGGALSAFNLETGKRVWARADDGPSYASPVVAEIADTQQLITQSEHAFISVDPTTGELLWQVPYTTPYDQNIVTSVIDGEYVITSGLDQGIAAYHPTQENGKWSVEKVWHNTDISVYMSSPVKHRGHIFGHSHFKRGQFFRLNGDNGESVWTSEGRQGENATLLATQEWMFVLTTNGELLVLDPAADTFDPVARYTVSQTPVWAHLAITDRGFLVKDKSTLALWSFPK